MPATAGAILVGAGPSKMEAELESRLSRPVTLLDVSRREEWSFYASKK